MPDTVRTWATLLGTTLADNSSGDISPQDLRDAFVSQQVYGGIYVADASSGASWSSTPALFAQFTANMASANITSDHTADRLTLSANGAGDYLIYYQLTLYGSAGATTAQVHVRKNGTEQYIGSHRYLSGTNDTGSMSAMGILTLAGSDYIELYREADVTRTITCIDGQFMAFRIA